MVQVEVHWRLHGGHDLATVEGSWLWLARRAVDQLQWGHDLAAVEGGSYLGSGRACLGFNGATTLRPWKVLKVCKVMGDPPASMGPRPCGRGRPTAQGHSRRHAHASMGPRPCGRGRLITQNGYFLVLSSFNGATTLRPWKVGYSSAYPTARKKLQWGHDLAAVEGGDLRGALDQRLGLQWGHDLAAVEGIIYRLTLATSLCFNGATTLRPWKADSSFQAFHDLPLLQWGHDLAAVEGRGTVWPVSSTQSFNGATTLRPWKAV